MASVMSLALDRAGASEEALEAFSMDEAEFREFYARTSRPLHGYLCHISGNVTLADDLLQESYFRFLRARRPSMSGDQMKSYLFKIGSNLVRDHLRRGEAPGASGSRPAHRDDGRRGRRRCGSKTGRRLPRPFGDDAALPADPLDGLRRRGEPRRDRGGRRTEGAERAAASFPRPREDAGSPQSPRVVAMNVPSCAREEAVLRAVRLDRWDDDLREHARDCAVCADVALAASFMKMEAGSHAAHPLPAADTIFWKARLLARREAAKRAAWACALIAGVALAFWVSPVVTRWAAHMATAYAAGSQAPSAPVTHDLGTVLLFALLPIALTITVLRTLRFTSPSRNRARPN